jgi:uncharacterized Ntn-hydrolase superfamily protein
VQLRPTGVVLRVVQRVVLCIVLGAGAVLVLGLAAPAGATWSLVATDSATGEVGVALASCVPVALLGPPEQPLAPVIVAPGRAAAVTQGQFDQAAPPRIRQLLEAGAEPDSIVGDLIDPVHDSQGQTRQHAVVTIDGAVAAFTGAELAPAATDSQGNGVSVQGNLLVSDEVVGEALAAYEESRRSSSDLSQALVDGLVAGSRAGGDRRCGAQTALFAQLVVTEPGDPEGRPARVLTVSVDEGDGQNPVEALAGRFADGDNGFVDAGSARRRGGAWVAGGALAVAGFTAVAGALLYRAGLGSVRARR